MCNSLLCLIESVELKQRWVWFGSSSNDGDSVTIIFARMSIMFVWNYFFCVARVNINLRELSKTMMWWGCRAVAAFELWANNNGSNVYQILWKRYILIFRGLFQWVSALMIFHFLATLLHMMVVVVMMEAEMNENVLVIDKYCYVTYEYALNGYQEDNGNTLNVGKKKYH